MQQIFSIAKFSKYLTTSSYSTSKLRKLVAIYRTSKLVISKKNISLTTRGSEKEPYSKVFIPDLFSVTK